MRILIATVAAMAAVLTAVPAQADPNVHEGGQAEPAYIAAVRQADPHEKRSNAQLLADGRLACSHRNDGRKVLSNLSGVTGTEMSWALTYLCPGPPGWEVGDF